MLGLLEWEFNLQSSKNQIRLELVGGFFAAAYATTADHLVHSIRAHTYGLSSITFQKLNDIHRHATDRMMVLAA